MLHRPVGDGLQVGVRHPAVAVVRQLFQHRHYPWSLDHGVEIGHRVAHVRR